MQIPIFETLRLDVAARAIARPVDQHDLHRRQAGRCLGEAEQGSQGVTAFSAKQAPAWRRGR